MKKSIVCTVVAVVLLSVLLSVPDFFAQEKTDDKGRLTVPWEEFKKLLRLDEKEIVLSLETFEKLLAQTGAKTKPPHTVKEGNVILSRTEFKKLVDQMKPPTDRDAAPPFDYLVTKAVYSGKMQTSNTDFTGMFHVHVLKENAYLKIPLLIDQIALKNVQVDGKDALIVSERGYHHVMLSAPGTYAVTASFSIKSSLERGPQKIDLPIQQTPITLLSLEMPLKNIDVEVPQAHQMQTQVRETPLWFQPLYPPDGPSVSGGARRLQSQKRYHPSCTARCTILFPLKTMH